MNKNKLGNALIIIAIILIAYTGYNFVTTRKVVDIGPIKIYKGNSHTYQWTAITSVVLFIGGILLIVRDKKNHF